MSSWSGCATGRPNFLRWETLRVSAAEQPTAAMRSPVLALCAISQSPLDIGFFMQPPCSLIRSLIQTLCLVSCRVVSVCLLRRSMDLLAGVRDDVFGKSHDAKSAGASSSDSKSGNALGKLMDWSDASEPQLHAYADLAPHATPAAPAAHPSVASDLVPYRAGATSAAYSHPHPHYDSQAYSYGYPAYDSRLYQHSYHAGFCHPPSSHEPTAPLSSSSSSVYPSASVYSASLEATSSLSRPPGMNPISDVDRSYRWTHQPTLSDGGGVASTAGHLAAAASVAAASSSRPTSPPTPPVISILAAKASLRSDSDTPSPRASPVPKRKQPESSDPPPKSKVILATISSRRVAGDRGFVIAI